MGDSLLTITIPPEDSFYSLFSDGLFIAKQYDKEADITELSYNQDSAIFLYYTYPTHRRAYLVRNVPENGGRALVGLPGISKKVQVLFRQFASRVDKTKRAVSYLNSHYENAYLFSDLFYYRLDIILSMKGKLNYRAIDSIVKNALKGEPSEDLTL
jgi:hypothetical protein